MVDTPSQHIAGLVYVSQLGSNTHQGIITGFDYTHGIINVADSAGGNVRVQLNDPKLTDALGNQSGRFSAGQSPDPRFSVDQDNPTVHAATGYPMCVPRTDPAAAADPLCPQTNRPLAPPTPNPTGIPACRNFSSAGVIPPTSGELTRPAAGQVYCTQFVMPNPAITTVGGDARQQAPFEIGDFIAFSGTKFTDATGDYISAHTVEANVGIYTQPGTQPSYTAIGEFGVGTADPLAISVNGAAQETADRIFLESETSDVKTPIDIYYQDAPGNGGNPANAPMRNRWTTPTEMTGENATPVSGPTGGITTQNVGPQPQRARIRATKAPLGLLSQPSRTVRIAQRTLCLPTPVGANVTTRSTRSHWTRASPTLRWWPTGSRPGSTPPRPSSSSSPRTSDPVTSPSPTTSGTCRSWSTATAPSAPASSSPPPGERAPGSRRGPPRAVNRAPG